jgi:hypothetical protein
MQILYYLCTKAMTNTFSSIFLLSHRLKGKGVFGEEKVSTPLYRYHLPFAVTPHHSSIGIIFTHILFTNGGESKKGLTKSPFLTIHAKGGESISPKQKDHTTT